MILMMMLCRILTLFWPLAGRAVLIYAAVCIDRSWLTAQADIIRRRPYDGEYD